MEKTLSININGWVFNINEDAYNLLTEYFKNLAKYFSKEDGGAEIVSDIEARVSELLKEKMPQNETAINISQIQEIMEIMGQPYEMETESEKEATDDGYKDYKNAKGKRKLFRNPENSHIAGVAAGIGTYLNLDPIFIRIAFLLLIFTGGAGIILYIALWILIPIAATTSDRIRMEGKKVDIKNIEKKVKEEAAYITDRLSEFSAEAKDAYHKTKPARKISAQKFEDFFKSIGRIIVRSLKFLLGLILFLTGVGLLVPLAIFSFNWLPGLNFDTFSIHGISLPEFLSVYLFDTQHTIILLSSLIIIILIPISMLIFNGIRFLFNIKRKKMVGTIAFQIWLAAFIITIGFSYTTFTAFRHEALNITSHNIKNMNSDTLFVKLNTQSYFQNVMSSDHKTVISQDENFPILHDGVFYGEPRLKIRYSEDDEFKLKLFLTANGHDEDEANNNIQKMSYTFDIDSTTLILDPYYKLKENEKWRNQEVRIEIFVPENQVISIDSNIPKYLKMNYEWRSRLRKIKEKESYWQQNDNEFTKPKEHIMLNDSLISE